jgi:hypothetical protein
MGLEVRTSIRNEMHARQRLLISFSSDATNVVSGVTFVSIFGYNFGTSVGDILSVTVKGHHCSTVELINDSEVRCSISRNLAESTVFPPSSLIANENGLTQNAHPPDIDPKDVSITTTRGTWTGVHPVPDSVSKSASRRLVVSAVTASFNPFIPYAGIFVSI